jgi:hypothetical protein
MNKSLHSEKQTIGVLQRIEFERKVEQSQKSFTY